MSIIIDGEEKKIGLALSGGGFRAAAFHLGVFKKLLEMDLLWKVDVISCVSGGSIAGATLALNWQREDVINKLHNYLNTRSIAVSSVLEGLFHPFETRLDRLAQSYKDDLFGNKTLDDLKNGPRIYFNSTNISTGNLFSFVAGGNGPSEMGDYELGFKSNTAPGYEIAYAVAASSAFPPVFPPSKVDQSVYENDQVEYVTLSDGGVYDNLGVNPIFANINKLDYAIVSDAGKPFDIDETPTEKGTIVLKEAINILMEQVRGLQFDRLVYRHQAASGPKPIWFSIDSTEGEAQTGDAVFSSSVKTHLEKLDAQTLAILSRHGGSLLNDRLTNYAPQLIPS